jgi:hypothetical protein
MAYERLKTEIKGTRSRCIPRADAKTASDRLRREADKRACDEGERDIWTRPSAAELRAVDSEREAQCKTTKQRST